MLRDLACRFPRMHQALALANEAAGDSDVPISSRIYPHSVFSDREQLVQEHALRDTQNAQPAIGAVSLGLLGILEDFGVRAELSGGHSFGELLALRAAGRIDDTALAFLAANRGRLMAVSDSGEEPGAMLAVLAPPEVVRKVLDENALELVIANKNAPRQCVLSGPSARIKLGEAVFAAQQVATQPLGVSRAFHSPLVSAAETSFHEALESIAFAPSSIPVFSNTTALPYPTDDLSARAVLARQLANPVEFVAQVEAMYQMGARTFLEVGPDSKLCSLVHAILEGKDHRAIAVDASRGSAGNVYDFACALASLAAAGHAVDLSRWDSDFKPPAEQRPGLLVKICGANPRPKATTQKMEPQHANGQSKAHDLGQLIGTEKRDQSPAHKELTPPPATVRFTPQQSPAGVERALQNARESLIALQRMSEQTAALHRQFLEGQEKTQQAFMKLLENEQRLSWALIGSPPERVELPDEPAAIASSRRIELAPEKDAPVTMPVARTNGDGRKAPSPQHHALAPAVAPASPDSNGSLAAVVIEVVSEKTGYPADVLDLDMQLDADLGIDSIKRVEILSALQERLPSLPPIAPELLGTLRTLRAVVEQLAGAPLRDEAAIAPPEAAQSQGDSGASPNAAPEIARVLLETVADKTGYPAEMLELDMRLDADLGIDSIKRVEIFSALQEKMPGARAAGPEEIGTLGTLREIVSFLDRSSGATTAQESPTRATGVADGPVARPAAVPDPSALRNGDQRAAVPGSVVLRTLCPRPRALETPDRRDPVTLRSGGAIWITDDGSPLSEALKRRLSEQGYAARVIGLDDVQQPEPSERLCGLIVRGSRDASDHAAIGKAFRAMRTVAGALEESAARGGASFMTVARLDGSFGLNGLSAKISPVSGAYAGLAKTAAREWPAVNCKAIDLDAAFDVPDGAARLIVEELHKRGPLEVGLSRQGRMAIELEELPVPAVVERRGRDLAPGDVVVLSGGGRGITASVAIALATAFQPRLIVLGRTPAPGPEEAWHAGLDDEAGLKRALAARSSRRLTPHELKDEAQRLLAERELRQNLDRIKKAGSPVVYHSIDVRDGAAVRAAIARARQEFGPIRGLVHGAGVLADRKIVDQSDAQFDSVYGTKVEGLENLFKAIDPLSLSLVVLFSSSTARFGRVGQVAYAAANEFLNKWAQQQAVRLSGCRVVSFNWGPWAGGMVTDALKPIFEQEGHSLIPLDAGARLVVEEARRAAGSPVELVVAAEPVRAVEPARSTATARPEAPAREGLQTVLKRVVDLESAPVLGSHIIDGHPVLPVALILEWMAEAATARNPGLLVSGVDDFRLFKGVILGHQNPRPSSCGRANPFAGLLNSRCRSRSAARWPAAKRWLMRGL